jgi:nucleoside-diphosphate-sugar epimerase
VGARARLLPEDAQGLSLVRVLLIGGTGFLGRHTARALLAAGYDVTVMSRGNCPALPGAEALIADRRDAAALARVLEGHRFDFTVDFAAYEAADIEPLLLVPYAALGRYVMISSGQVYLVTQPEAAPYREEDSDRPLKPEPPEGTHDHGNWVYGMGKRRAEGALLSLRSSYGVRGVILRIPVVIGESDPTLRLWAYIERMLDGGPLLLPDGGHRPVRFIFANDLARVVKQLIENRPPREAVYNLAQPEMLPLRDVLTLIARAAGVTPRFVEASWAEIAEAGIDRWFSPFAGSWTSLIDPSRAGAEWGFLGTRMEEYLPGVVRWNLEHRPSESHHGYANRAKETELAARLAGAAR